MKTLCPPQGPPECEGRVSWRDSTEGVPVAANGPGTPSEVNFILSG